MARKSKHRKPTKKLRNKLASQKKENVSPVVEEKEFFVTTTERPIVLEEEEPLQEEKTIIEENEIEENIKEEHHVLFGVFATVVTLIALVGTLIWFGHRWLLDTFPNVTMEEMIFTATNNLKGASKDMIQNAIMQIVVPAVAVMVVLPLVLWFTRKNWFSKVMMVGSVLLSGGASYIAYKDLDSVMALEEYVVAQTTSSDWIENHYVDPKEVSIVFPEKKRNLIFIYLESMEVTYSSVENGGNFYENIIPELTTIAEENEDFSGEDWRMNGAYVLPGNTFTMGGMFGTTSGLPLKYSVAGIGEDVVKDNVFIGVNDFDTQDTFFPDILNLGDILQKEGYNQNLLVGSDAKFGGRELYFTVHGDYDVYDYYYALEEGIIPQDYFVWWGFEDKYLFEMAKARLNDLASQEEPFNLTMLTVDTHFEDGYICSDCPNYFWYNQYANALNCSDTKVGEFIRWIQDQDWYENTTIVITGDHLTMDSDFCQDVDWDYERKTYTAYINSAVNPAQPDRKRVYTTLDHFPTTLASLGVRIEGHRLGLGTNLFSSFDTLVEEMGFDELKAAITPRSPFMDSLANYQLNTAAFEERRGEGELMTTLFVDEFDPMNKTVLLRVGNVNSTNKEIIRVEIELEDTSHPDDEPKRIMMRLKEDGDYERLVSLVGYHPEDIQVHTYCYDKEGNEYKTNVLGLELPDVEFVIVDPNEEGDGE